MRLRDIAVANLKVRKAKTFFLFLGIFFGITALVALFTVTGTLRNEVETQFREQGLKLLILPHREDLSLSYRGITVPTGFVSEQGSIPPDILERLEADELAGYISVTAPRIVGKADINGMETLLVGIDPLKEVAIKPWWQVYTGAFPVDGQLLVGYRLAEDAGLSSGMAISINGRDLTVSGILTETGEQDDRMAFLPLSTAFDLLNTDRFSFVELVIPVDGIIAGEEERIVSLVRQQVPEVDIVQIKNELTSRRELADSFSRFSFIISLLILFASAVIVLVTMMGSVQERVSEIGAFRAIGYRSGHIASIILTEALYVGLAGGAAGYAMGLLLSLPAGRVLLGVATNIVFEPLLFIEVMFVAVFVSALASLYPAYRAASLDPVESIHQI